MAIKITKYDILCNLGDCTEIIYKRAIEGVASYFEIEKNIIKDKSLRLGKINCSLPSVHKEEYNLRCNQLILKLLENINAAEVIKKYGEDEVAVVVATTNTGGMEYETSKNIRHAEIGNPACFVKDYLKLKNFYSSISTACSSGLKAFSIGSELLNSNFAKAVLVIGVDSISKVPLFGFDSLEILSPEKTNPFGKNRNGINIGEGAGVFVLEKDVKGGIEILGTGETTDFYHPTTPDPTGEQAIEAINLALKGAKLNPYEIDYINLHGTGTIVNDLSEGRAVNHIFKDKVIASSTKPLTGHCLGAAATIEAGLCCKLIELKSEIVYPHIYSGIYDEEIPPIKLAKLNEQTRPVQNVLCTSFGFGGSNAAIILGAGS